MKNHNMTEQSTSPSAGSLNLDSSQTQKSIEQYRRKWKMFRLVKLMAHFCYLTLTFMCAFTETLVSVFGIAMHRYYQNKYTRGSILGCNPGAVVELVLTASVLLLIASIINYCSIVVQLAKTVWKDCVHNKDEEKKPSCLLKVVTKSLSVARIVFVCCASIIITSVLPILFLNKESCKTVSPMLMSDVTYFVCMVIGVEFIAGFLYIVYSLIDSLFACFCTPKVPKLIENKE
jgi:uncharacterized membrane protein